MIYADTNFFVNLLVGMPSTNEAERLATGMKAPLPITRLLRLEFVNALQQCVFLTRRGSQDRRVTPELATAVESYFLDEADAGSQFRNYQCSENDVESVFRTLSHRHTAKEGFRAYDILHVAQALVLGCDTFWSFDEKARKLAKLEGLKVN